MWFDVGEAGAPQHRDWGMDWRWMIGCCCCLLVDRNRRRSLRRHWGFDEMDIFDGKVGDDHRHLRREGEDLFLEEIVLSLQLNVAHLMRDPGAFGSVDRITVDAVEIVPDLDGVFSDEGGKFLVHVIREGHVVRVAKVGDVVVDVRPERDGGISDLVDAALALRVVQEGAEATTGRVVHDALQKVGVVLKLIGELLHDLPDTVDELHKNRTSLTVVVVGITVAESLGKLVSERAPILLDQHLKTLDRPVVRTQQNLSQRRDLCFKDQRQDQKTIRKQSEKKRKNLRSSIPSITAMHEYRASTTDEIRDINGGFEDAASMFKPFGVGNSSQP